MKMLIQIDENRNAILIEGDAAGAAAAILAGSRVMKRDGYGNDSRWSPASEQVRMHFITNDRVQPYTERETALEKQLSEKQSESWKKYTEIEAQKKQIAELTAQLELLKSVTVCTQTEPVSEQVKDEPARSYDEDEYP